MTVLLGTLNGRNANEEKISDRTVQDMKASSDPSDNDSPNPSETMPIDLNELSDDVVLVKPKIKVKTMSISRLIQILAIGFILFLVIYTLKHSLDEYSASKKYKNALSSCIGKLEYTQLIGHEYYNEKLELEAELAKMTQENKKLFAQIQTMAWEQVKEIRKNN